VRETDRKIAGYVAKRIRDGATLQAGIGSIPDEVLGLLDGQKDLGVNTELLSDGFIDLIDNGVITGTRKRNHRNKTITRCLLRGLRIKQGPSESPP
jgi:acyl-CoA hydrolase